MSISPDPVDIACGARVRFYRKAQGKSQSALADALGLTFQQVQKYEKGANRISVSMLTKIAAFLEVPGSELMGESSPPVSDEMIRSMAVPGADRVLRAYGTLPHDTRVAIIQLIETVARSR